MTALLRRMLDETEFLSDYGVRSVSKIHATAPFVYDFEGTRFSVDYEPGESTTTLFGGNSNWRGPIWMPINFLMIEALYEFEKFYEPSTKIECPTGSGHFLTIPQIAAELTRRLTALFLRDAKGRRPVLGDAALPGRPGVPRQHPVPRIFPRRHGRRPRRHASDGLVGARGLAAAAADPGSGQADGGLDPEGIAAGAGVSLAVIAGAQRAPRG